MVKIITDTTSCLPEKIQHQYQISVIPQLIHIGEKTYREGVDIDNRSFMELLQNSDELPKTAAPPPEYFKTIFRNQAGIEEPLLCIHPSSDLSGTVRSAETARLDFPDLDIRIIDTRLIASPLGILVHQAAIWSTQTTDTDDLVRRINSLASRGKIYFLVKTLEFLSRGGRIGGASALLGTALQIKPILSLIDGQVIPHLKERTFSRAIDKIKTLVLEEYPADQEGFLSIMHAGNPELASDLSHFLQENIILPPPLIHDLPPAIITHAGPGSIAVGFFS